MSPTLVFIIVAVIAALILVYRFSGDEGVYKYVKNKSNVVIEKLAPYSYTEIRQKINDLGQNYTAAEYLKQIAMFGGLAAIVAYMYFYNIIICVIYAIVAISFIPYLSYLRSKRLYSEYVFEQIQVYTTNTIMEFSTVQSFVKALEGVYESGVLEDPVKTDVKVMIDLAYDNGTIDESLKFFNQKYPFHIVKNMHQLFYQITNEGSRDAGETLDNMSNDIDMLVENVYRDRIDRAAFHKKFLQFGIVLYLMIMLVQFLLGHESYITLLNDWTVMILLHGVVLLNSYFLLSGEKYYNEDVGAE